MLQAIQRFIIALTIVAFVIVQRELFRSRIIDYNLLKNDDRQFGDASSFIRYQRVEGYTSLDLVAGKRHKLQLIVVSSDTQYSYQAFTDKGNLNADDLNGLILFLFEKQVFLLDVNILREFKLSISKFEMVFIYTI